MRSSGTAGTAGACAEQKVDDPVGDVPRKRPGPDRDEGGEEAPGDGAEPGGKPVEQHDEAAGATSRASARPPPSGGRSGRLVATAKPPIRDRPTGAMTDRGGRGGDQQVVGDPADLAEQGRRAGGLPGRDSLRECGRNTALTVNPETSGAITVRIEAK